MNCFRPPCASTYLADEWEFKPSTDNICDMFNAVNWFSSPCVKHLLGRKRSEVPTG